MLLDTSSRLMDYIDDALSSFSNQYCHDAIGSNSPTINAVSGLNSSATIGKFLLDDC